jgi:iron(III) transport system permease protein
MGRAVDVLIKVGAPIPAIVLAVGLLVGVGGEPFFLAGTFMILLLAYIGHFLPQATVNGDVAAAQVGPQLVEASHISGAGDGRTFMRISLPLMLPDLIAGWALLFLWMFGEFNASVILSGVNTPVVGLQMYNLYEQGFYGRLAALAIVVLVICTAVVAAATFIARLIRGGRPKVKG